jgi:Ribbon-helix-helix protein, copG family
MTTITCKIPGKLNARLEALARRRRTSKSAILRLALEKQLAQRSAAPSAFDLIKSLCGTLHGPKDLSTNPKHLKGFGE